MRITSAEQGARLPVRTQTLHDLMLVVILTFPIFGTFFPFDTYIGAYPGRSTTIVLALILGIAGLLFARQPQKAMVALRRAWPVLLFCCWALYNTTYAEVPGEAISRSGRLLIYSLYAIYLAEMLDNQRARRIIGLSLLLTLFLSLATIAVLPSLAASTDGRGILGTWRGAMGHKNGLGIFAALGLLFALISLKTKTFDRRLSLALLCISAILIVLANSATALIAAIIGSGILFYLFYVLPVVGDRLLGVILGIVCAIAGGLLIQSLGSVLELFGRDGTLTGRAPIWAYANMLIDQNPFWGYGLGAWKYPIFYERALAALHVPIAHAHNTWLDLRLQLGLPGLCLAIAMLAITFRNLAYLFTTRPLRDFIFPLVVLVAFGFRSYSETVVVDPALSDMFWIASVFALLAKMASAERNARSRQRRASGAIRSNLDIPRRSFGAEPTF